MSQQNGMRLCLVGFIILVLGLLGRGPLARGASLSYKPKALKMTTRQGENSSPRRFYASKSYLAGR